MNEICYYDFCPEGKPYALAPLRIHNGWRSHRKNSPMSGLFQDFRDDRSKAIAIKKRNMLTH